jgi:hypothetical protein
MLDVRRTFPGPPPPRPVNATAFSHGDKEHGQLRQRYVAQAEDGAFRGRGSSPRQGCGSSHEGHRDHGRRSSGVAGTSELGVGRLAYVASAE